MGAALGADLETRPQPNHDWSQGIPLNCPMKIMVIVKKRENKSSLTTMVTQTRETKKLLKSKLNMSQNPDNLSFLHFRSATQPVAHG